MRHLKSIGLVFVLSLASIGVFAAQANASSFRDVQTKRFFESGDRFLDFDKRVTGLLSHLADSDDEFEFIGVGDIKPVIQPLLPRWSAYNNYVYSFWGFAKRRFAKAAKKAKKQIKSSSKKGKVRRKPLRAARVKLKAARATWRRVKSSYEDSLKPRNVISQFVEHLNRLNQTSPAMTGGRIDDAVYNFHTGEIISVDMTSPNAQWLVSQYWEFLVFQMADAYYWADYVLSPLFEANYVPVAQKAAALAKRARKR